MMNRTERAVEVRELRKRYGETVAVDGLSFSVARGSIYGLLGPNGAGKTTTLECIEGLRSPDSGTISVMGIDPTAHQKQLWDVIGVQLQESGLPGTMTSREAMEFFCRYHGRTPRYEMLERFGLSDHMEKQYANLSTGQRRRLSLALSVAHEPQVLFLDEPTAGLDVQSRTELHALMKELREDGMSIVLSTHDMAEAEKLCDRIGILIQGRLAIEGTPSTITAAGDNRTKIRVASALSSIRREEPAVAGAAPAESEDGYAAFWSEKPAESVAAILAFLKDRGDELVDLRVERPSLEERFMEITAEGVRRESR
ncbi:MAG: ABC transporter ATP-binding protein [Spirochaetaceae bacterium]